MLYSRLHKFQISHWIGKKLLTDRFIGFRLLHQLVSKISWTHQVKRNGVKIKIPIVQGMGVVNLVSDYERWLDNLLPKLLQGEMPAVLDIGANTGQTLIKIKSLFPQSEYLGVEANPDCVAYLKKLSDLNQFENVRFASFALADKAGQQTLQLRYRDDLLATTTPEFRVFTRYAHSVKVPGTTGDLLIEKENIAQLNLIKIDVEGGESQVLEGLTQTINRFRPLILCEILPLNSKSKKVANFRTHAAGSILQICENLKYTIYNLNSWTPVEEVQQFSDSLESANYLFVPKEKVNTFQYLSEGVHRTS